MITDSVERPAPYAVLEFHDKPLEGFAISPLSTPDPRRQFRRVPPALSAWRSSLLRVPQGRLSSIGRRDIAFAVPLIWTMINFHTSWAATSWLYLLALILIAWVGVNHLLKKAGKVPGV